MLMGSQGIKAKLVGVGIFVGSIGGTFALFGCVPMLAHLLSPGHVSPANQQVAPSQFQAFPKAKVPDASSSSKTVSEPALPVDRSKQARTIFDRRTNVAPQPRSAL